MAATNESSGIRRIWLCADDYGISPSVDVAIRDLVARGRINATSVMVVSPSFHRSEAKALDILNAGQERVAVGLHLTLSAPFAPVSKSFTPIRGGGFPPFATMAIAACLYRLDRAALEEEVAEQIRRFTDTFGRAPRFIDGHRHIHLFPQIRDALLKVVKAQAPQSWLRQCGSPLSLSEKISDPKGILLDLFSRSFRYRSGALGVATNPAFAGTYNFHEQVDFAALFPGFFDRLPDGSVVMCHPGFVDAELRRLDPLTTLREQEYAFFSADGFPDLLASHRITLKMQDRIVPSF